MRGFGRGVAVQGAGDVGLGNCRCGRANGFGNETIGLGWVRSGVDSAKRRGCIMSA